MTDKYRMPRMEYRQHHHHIITQVEFGGTLCRCGGAKRCEARNFESDDFRQRGLEAVSLIAVAEFYSSIY